MPSFIAMTRKKSHETIQQMKFHGHTTFVQIDGIKYHFTSDKTNDQFLNTNGRLYN